MLVCGLALAILVAVLEFCWNSKKNAQSDRVSERSIEIIALAIPCFACMCCMNVSSSSVQGRLTLLLSLDRLLSAIRAYSIVYLVYTSIICIEIFARKNNGYCNDYR